MQILLLYCHSGGLTSSLQTIKIEADCLGAVGQAAPAEEAIGQLERWAEASCRKFRERRNLSFKARKRSNDCYNVTGEPLGDRVRCGTSYSDPRSRLRRRRKKRIDMAWPLVED